MQKPNRGLVYFISETHHFERKSSIAVIGLVGCFVERNERLILECLDAVSRQACKAVVLNFRDVFPETDASTAGWVKRMVGTARERSLALRVSAIHPLLREHLLRTGSVSEEDIVNNLAQALEVLTELDRAAA